MCNVYRHIVRWFDEACVHRLEADNIASPSDQWTEATVYHAYTHIAPKKISVFFGAKTHVCCITFLLYYTGYSLT